MFFKSKQHPSLLHPWLTSCSCWVHWEQLLSPWVFVKGTAPQRGPTELGCPALLWGPEVRAVLLQHQVASTEADTQKVLTLLAVGSEPSVSKSE